MSFEFLKRDEALSYHLFMVSVISELRVSDLILYHIVHWRAEQPCSVTSAFLNILSNFYRAI